MQSYSKHYQRKVKHAPFVSLVEPTEMLTTVKMDFEGKAVTGSKFVVENPTERFKGLKASDFAIENQIAVGVKVAPAKCSLHTNEIDYQIIQCNENTK